MTVSLNLGEYGQTIHADVGQDISGASEYKFIMQFRTGEKVEKTGTLGTTAITFNGQSLAANEYVSYTLVEGDLCRAGRLRYKGSAQMSATELVIGDYQQLTVLP